MCVIIYRPSDHQLDVDTLKTCATDNPDGWGIMYAEKGRVRSLRGMKFDDFLAAYLDLPADLPMGIHFRIRTHGQTNLKNCHPFSVLTLDEDGRDLSLMHNGVIRTDTIDPDMSDTWNWIEVELRDYLREAPNLLQSKGLRSLVEGTVEGSKLLLLDGDGTFFFLNEKSWHQHLGCQFSNDLSLYGEDQMSRYYGGHYQHKDNRVLGRFNEAEEDSFGPLSLAGGRSALEDGDVRIAPSSLGAITAHELRYIDEDTLTNMVWEEPWAAAELLIKFAWGEME